MPLIALFYGIRISMYYNDHSPPHFHAEYTEYSAAMSIIDGHVLNGSLPKRQLRLVMAWCELHRDELMQNWELAKSEMSLNRIDPLV